MTVLQAHAEMDQYGPAGPQFRFVRGQLILGGAGTAAENVPAFTSVPQVWISVDTAGPAVAAAGSLQCNVNAGVLNVVSTNGAADAGVVVNYLVIG